MFNPFKKTYTTPPGELLTPTPTTTPEIIPGFCFAQILNGFGVDCHCVGTYEAPQLIKYDFNPIIQITNFYNEKEREIINNFKTIFEKIGFETSDINFQINNCYNKLNEDAQWKKELINPDCKSGRIITCKGIYSCPFLANDHRGWSGNDFTNFSKKTYLETPYCAVCSKTKLPVFALNYSCFKN